MRGLLLCLPLLVLPASAGSPRPGQDATPTLAAGRALQGAGDHAGAASVFRALVEADENDATAWSLLGFSLHAQGLLEEALAVHERAATFPATAPTASYNAACVHARLGHTDQAFAWLDKAVAAGFSNRQLVQNDADLQSLRGDARFARVFPAVLEGAALFVEPTRVIHTLVGDAPGDQFGWVAREVGDLDGDGVLDFAATAPSNGAGGSWAGSVYVHSGRTGELLFRRDGQAGWSLGNSVAGGVDVNGDGTPDVIAGAPAAGQGAGRALVWSGEDGALIHQLSVGEPGDKFGMKVSGLEDLDGDGRAEVVVGAMTADAGGKESGRVSVHSGADGSELFALEGARAGDHFGSSVDATRSGGHRLLVVGAMDAGAGQRGRCTVYRCTADGAEELFVIEPEPTGAALGMYFAAILGDVDGDGVPDVYASDWNDAGNGPAAGRVYVHSGKTGARLLTLAGKQAGEGFGTSASVAGDADGDGRADLVVGAWQHASAAPSGGKVTLYSGASGAELAAWTCRQAGDTFGFDAVGLGDVDGDGGVDYLLTSAWSPAKGPRTGRVFVVAGPVPVSSTRADADRIR